MVKFQSKINVQGRMVIGADSGQPATVVAKYYFSEDTDWYNLANWYGTSNRTSQATVLPNANTDVIIQNGSATPIVDMDNVAWVQPKSINCGTTGIEFDSLVGASISCNIIGDPTFKNVTRFN